MLDTLYRPEILEAQRNAWMGTMRLSPPRAGWWGAAFVVAVLGVFGLGLNFGHYTRREPVTGRLVSDKGLIEVLPTSPGRVVQVLVKEGDVVAAGQPLIVLSSEQSSVRMGPLQSLVLAQLQNADASFSADRSAQLSTYDAQEQSMRAEVAALREQGAQIDEQVAVQATRTASAKALYDRWEAAANTGVVPKLQLLEQRDRFLESQTQLHEFRRQRLQITQQISKVQSQIGQLPSERTLAVNDIERRKSEIRRTMALTEAERASVLTASEPGRVTNLMAFVGQVVNEHEALMSVLPNEAVLQAELWVPSRAVGLIGVGDVISLRYSAFPYVKYGQHVGRIESISGSADSKIAGSSSVGTQELRYRVLVDIDSQTVRVGSTDIALKPGMAIDADVSLDRRRLIDFVLEPFRHVGASFRPLPEGRRT